MNIAEMLGTPVDDPDEFDPPPASPCATTPPPLPTPQERRHPGRLVWVVVTAAALVVAACLGWYFASISAEPTAPLVVAYPDQVGGFAEMFTALSLSGRTPPGEHDGLSSADAPRATGTWVHHSAPVLVEPLAQGFWNVTVVVDALELVDDSYESAGLQYFAVTVDAREAHPVAVAAPTRIPAPSIPAPTDIPLFATTVATDQADAITQFLDGYLTGQKEIARYMTSTARVQQFTSPPYESISIVSMGGDSLGRVAVSVSATTAMGAVHNLQYTVKTSFAAGVWEVSGLTYPAIPE